MRLCDALGISRGDVVAFVGAGGKSSSIRVVARELASEGRSVVAAATTKMTAAQADSIGQTLLSENAEELISLVEGGLSPGLAVVAGSARISHDRIGGVEPETITALRDVSEVVLVEADGARGKLVKGTADHEPVIPSCANQVVAVAGIGALGKPVTDEFVHRPELFSVQTGIGPGQSITARSIARSIMDGSLADIPENAHPAVLLTGVTPGNSMSDAAVIARELWRFGIKKVIFTSLTVRDDFQVWNP